MTASSSYNIPSYVEEKIIELYEDKISHFISIDQSEENIFTRRINILLKDGYKIIRSGFVGAGGINFRHWAHLYIDFDNENDNKNKNKNKNKKYGDKNI